MSEPKEMSAEEIHAYRTELARVERRHKRRVWRERDLWGDYYLAGYVCGQEVSEGGWYHTDGKLKNWMSKTDLEAFRTRAWQRSEDAAPKETIRGITWIPNQCGGCKWFAALNSDWGFCCNEGSPLDGRVVFEHGGCEKHSNLEVTP